LFILKAIIEHQRAKISPSKLTDIIVSVCCAFELASRSLI